MQSTRKVSVRLVIVAFAIALIAAACGSSGSKGGNSAPKNGSTGTTVVNVPQGGTLTIGAHEQPKCFDWLDQCASSAWGTWIAQLQTQPYAFRTVPTGAPNSGDLTLQPSTLLAGMPTFVPTPIETITYKINPAAVWSDLVPITCADFQYTVDQQQNGTNLFSTTGYDDIDKVKCPDAKTVVVSYKKGTSFADWRSLFSAGVGIFPSHILKGKNRDKMMKDGYTWSGGPWMIQKWDKGQDLILVPNKNYWGPKPHLAQVVFKFITDTAAEFEAMKSGQVDAIYPPPELDTVNDITSGGLTDFNTAYNSNTASVEGLWMNNQSFPLDSVPVRKAVAYAIDRAAIVQKLFGPLGVSTPANSLNPFVLKDYADLDAFKAYHLDPNMVNQLMTGAGWAKGSNGVWAKGGKKATMTIDTTVGDKARELTEQVLQQQLKDAGFTLTIKNEKSDDLFSTTLPNGTYQLSIYANSLTGITPGLCQLFCSDQIPSAANQNAGENTTFTSIPQLDSLLKTVDTSLDDSARMAAAKQADDLMAANMVSLPLDPSPDILIWSKKVVGPIQDNAVEGMFYNLDQWGITS